MCVKLVDLTLPNNHLINNIQYVDVHFLSVELFVIANCNKHQLLQQLWLYYLPLIPNVLLSRFVSLFPSRYLLYFLYFYIFSVCVVRNGNLVLKNSWFDMPLALLLLNKYIWHLAHLTNRNRNKKFLHKFIFKLKLVLSSQKWLDEKKI